MGVQTGLDRLQAKRFQPLRGGRFALLIHQASVNQKGEHILELLHRENLKPVRIFTPEHGLFGEEQDQVPVESEQDPIWGLPLCSLYGQDPTSLSPRSEDLEDIDIVILDLQDVGVRYYTFVYTMAYVVRKAAQVGTRVMVLDRPNPLGGEKVEGGGVEPALRSFVGAFSIPVLHGMTPGELLLMWNETEGWKANLEVIPMKGWDRSMLFKDTGLVWVPPSPNMPWPTTAHVYAATCLLEGTNVSEGRGTTRPFEQFGAPWINALELQKALRPEGAHLRPTVYVPTFHKYQGEKVQGLFIHVQDWECFSPLEFGYTLLSELVQFSSFQWREEPYEFRDDVRAVDLLLGQSWIRPRLETGDVKGVMRRVEEERVRFITQRRPFLMYI